jgi:hypothetical protein
MNRQEVVDTAARELAEGIGKIADELMKFVPEPGPFELSDREVAALRKLNESTYEDEEGVQALNDAFERAIKTLVAGPFELSALERGVLAAEPSIIGKHGMKVLKDAFRRALATLAPLRPLHGCAIEWHHKAYAYSRGPFELTQEERSALGAAETDCATPLDDKWLARALRRAERTLSPFPANDPVPGPFTLSDLEQEALATARSCAQHGDMLKSYKAERLATALERAVATLAPQSTEQPHGKWSDADRNKAFFAYAEARGEEGHAKSCNSTAMNAALDAVAYRLVSPEYPADENRTVEAIIADFRSHKTLLSRPDVEKLIAAATRKPSKIEDHEISRALGIWFQNERSEDNCNPGFMRDMRAAIESVLGEAPERVNRAEPLLTFAEARTADDAKPHVNFSEEDLETAQFVRSVSQVTGASRLAVYREGDRLQPEQLDEGQGLTGLRHITDADVESAMLTLGEADAGDKDAESAAARTILENIRASLWFSHEVAPLSPEAYSKAQITAAIAAYNDSPFDQETEDDDVEQSMRAAIAAAGVPPQKPTTVCGEPIEAGDDWTAEDHALLNGESVVMDALSEAERESVELFRESLQFRDTLDARARADSLLAVFDKRFPPRPAPKQKTPGQVLWESEGHPEPWRWESTEPGYRAKYETRAAAVIAAHEASK